MSPPGDVELRALLLLHGLTPPADMEQVCLAAMAELRRQAVLVASLTDALEEPALQYDVRRTVRSSHRG